MPVDGINYIFQKKNYNSYQCGAYAIYNYLQYCGIHNVSLKSLIKKCKARKGIGTLVEDFNAALRGLTPPTTPLEVRGLTPTRFASPPTPLADAQSLPVRGVVGGVSPLTLTLIVFHWSNGAHQGNHYAFIDKMYYKYGSYSYRVINYSFDKPVHIISQRELKSMLMSYEDEHFKLPVVWNITEGVEL
jgi:hypothetical protein